MGEPVRGAIVGVDVGGTFSDAVVAHAGRVVQAKAATTPTDQSQGALAAIERALAAAGVEADEVAHFVHGTTVGTNALLEGKLARTALLATAGFEDLEELRRQNRRSLYRLCEHHPPPLVPPELRIGVPERCGPHGVVRALAGEALADRLRELDCEAFAVCLLWSFRFPHHERQLAKLLGECHPHAHVSLSHETAGVFREYERCATTIVDAAVSPRLRDYLRQLERRAGAAGLPAPEVMLSSGGTADAATAAAHGAWTVLSGPAAGAVAAARLAAIEGETRAVALDMGGTSCDVSLASDGRARVVLGGIVAGRPLALPLVEVHTVGAGGGSIAWRDEGGALRVGPRSAGAVPGPACYRRGGHEATVTDANLLLGYLPEDVSLGGELRPDRGAAARAIATLAATLGMDAPRCAEGIYEVACAEMAQAVQVLTVERGIDPRGLALCAFGGAGPLHAARIAEELGMRRVLVPLAAGVLSALGLATAERRRDAVASVLLSGDALTDGALRRTVAQLAARARDALGEPEAELRVTYELRYRGQSFELDLEAPPETTVGELRALLDEAHQARYGWHDPQAEPELVTVRVAAVGEAPAVDLPAPTPGRLRATHGVRWRGREYAAGVASGPVAGSGPLVVELSGATAFVPPGWRARLGRASLILEREAPR